jgi:hypothetical protein
MGMTLELRVYILILSQQPKAISNVLQKQQDAWESISVALAAAATPISKLEPSCLSLDLCKGCGLSPVVLLISI